MLTPVKAIRKNCINCAGSMGEVRKCPATSCSLTPIGWEEIPIGRALGDQGQSGLKICPTCLKNPNSSPTFLAKRPALEQMVMARAHSKITCIHS
jgi:hypothetical protein